jgi:hypothetical protein
MSKEELVKSMMDVVSHEFFSHRNLEYPLKEIQDFDYNDPRCHNIYGCMGSY